MILYVKQSEVGYDGRNRKLVKMLDNGSPMTLEAG